MSARRLKPRVCDMLCGKTFSVRNQNVKATSENWRGSIGRAGRWRQQRRARVKYGHFATAAGEADESWY